MIAWLITAWRNVCWYTSNLIRRLQGKSEMIRIPCNSDGSINTSKVTQARILKIGKVVFVCLIINGLLQEYVVDAMLLELLSEAFPGIEICEVAGGSSDIYERPDPNFGASIA